MNQPEQQSRSEWEGEEEEAEDDGLGTTATGGEAPDYDAGEFK